MTASVQTAYTGNASKQRPVSVRALAIRLDQCAHALGLVTTEQYTHKPAYNSNPDKLKGSMGEHMRHILEYIQAVLKGVETGVIDYDGRIRDRKIETETDYALQVIEDLRTKLFDLRSCDLEKKATVIEAVLVEEEDEPERLSVRSQLDYVVLHADHHLDDVRGRCDIFNIALPDDVGVAAATLRHWRQRLG